MLVDDGGERAKGEDLPRLRLDGSVEENSHLDLGILHTSPYLVRQLPGFSPGSPPQGRTCDGFLRSEGVASRSIMVYRTQGHGFRQVRAAAERNTLRLVWGSVDCIAENTRVSESFLVVPSFPYIGRGARVTTDPPEVYLPRGFRGCNPRLQEK